MEIVSIISAYEDLLKWAFAGFITLLLTIVWYAVREWISGVREGFLKVYTKLEELVDVIDKIEVLTHVQNEQLSQLNSTINKHDSQIRELHDKINEVKAEYITYRKKNK
ncbi:hypothetical protein [Aureibacter tunicatorum]|uniref:Methyl-accepting chemotaxis protein n=1 Tax=Aureibacter tunicatorum TaxID=866807 RepID=A0AAE3XT05_9BACT|nr:hypothetical protein [Aureibacter tunicatorum]MDR6241895.1 methyl-accepting chemotaxis protein [Aureibacter tunicatorum]BDD07444.1 hypothetical protein AUTU_49270 [Aureibacter tunicatorum]